MGEMKTKEIYFLLKITMSQAAMTNRHRLSRSNSRLHFPQFWAWKSEVRMLSLACRRLPGRQTDRQTDRKLSVSLSYKVARSTDEGPTLATSLTPIIFIKAPPPNTLTLEAGLQQSNAGGTPTFRSHLLLSL